MKLRIIVLLVLCGIYVCMHICKQKRDPFIEVLISEPYALHGFWLSISIESPEYKGIVVMENSTLFRYLIFKGGGLHCTRKYWRTIYRMLKENATLTIEETQEVLEQNDIYFFKVPDDTNIIANAQKGVEHFIETYARLWRPKYSLYALKHEFTVDEYWAIINQLYNFKIVVRRSGETGDFVLYRAPYSQF